MPRRSPECDRFQAIVPAYRFQCSGRVKEWGACVQPGGDNEEYYIQFQVWRPTGTEGCYELVGYNEPPVEDTQEGSEVRGSRSTNREYGILEPVNRCVVLTVRENEQIDFQPGDVVGYYVDYFRYRNMSGIQWIEDGEVVVYYRYDLPRGDIKSLYALNGPSPTECDFQIADTNIHTLSDSVTSAPIISLSLGKQRYIYCYILLFQYHLQVYIYSNSYVHASTPAVSLIFLTTSRGFINTHYSLSYHEPQCFLLLQHWCSFRH